MLGKPPGHPILADWLGAFFEEANIPVMWKVSKEAVFAVHVYGH